MASVHPVMGLLPVFANLVSSQRITPQAQLNPPESVDPQVKHYPQSSHGRLLSVRGLQKRGQNCDNHGVMFCPTGTCYTDTTGLIGCCTTDSCAPRTTCIPFDASITSPCDVNTGGCIYCSDPKLPLCMTITNPVEDQYIHYCDVRSSVETTSFLNEIRASSTVLPASMTASSGAPETTLQSSAESPTTLPSRSSRPSSTNPLEEALSTVITSSILSQTTGVHSQEPLTTQQSGPSAPGQTDSDANDHPKSHPSSATLAGIACGVGIGSFLLGCAVWVTRKQWLKCMASGRRTIDGVNVNGGEKQSEPSSDGNSGSQSDQTCRTQLGQCQSYQVSPISSSAMYSPESFTRYQELDSRPTSVALPILNNVSTSEAIGGKHNPLGIYGGRACNDRAEGSRGMTSSRKQPHEKQRYKITNPSIVSEPSLPEAVSLLDSLAVEKSQRPPLVADNTRIRSSESATKTAGEDARQRSESMALPSPAPDHSTTEFGKGLEGTKDEYHSDDIQTAFPVKHAVEDPSALQYAPSTKQDVPDIKVTPPLGGGEAGGEGREEQTGLEREQQLQLHSTKSSPQSEPSSPPQELTKSSQAPSVPKVPSGPFMTAEEAMRGGWRNDVGEMAMSSSLRAPMSSNAGLKE